MSNTYQILESKNSENVTGWISETILILFTKYSDHQTFISCLMWIGNVKQKKMKMKTENEIF